MFIEYVSKKFSSSSLEIIEYANRIIDEYNDEGYKLTLRQLYYQFVARDILPNSMRSYKRLGSIINDARLAGMVSWTAIEDRTRNLQSLSTWNTPADILKSAAHSYREDLWETQAYRPEVWIEKEALSGVVSGICEEYRVPYFACRGYTSQSEQWAAAMRFKKYRDNGQVPVVLHLGDHDPSGIDMTRDNRDRLRLLSGDDVEVHRLALNYNQIEQYNPPPNPAKLTDSRAEGYVSEFGHSSWELDALEPRIITNLIEHQITMLLLHDEWDKAYEREEKNVRRLYEMAQEFESRGDG